MNNLAKTARAMDRDLQSVDARLSAFGKNEIDHLDSLEIAVSIYSVADYILSELDPRDTHNVDLFRSFQNRAERLGAELHKNLKRALDASPKAVERPAVMLPLAAQNGTATRPRGQRAHLGQQQRQEILAMLKAGESVADIARAYGVSNTSIRYYRDQYLPDSGNGK